MFETTGTCDRAAAEEIRVKREAELLQESIHGRKATVTFQQAAAAYLEAGGDPRFLGTEDERTGKWSGLIGHFWGVRLASIGQSELDAAAKKLHPSAAPQTLNRQVYTPFVAVWNFAASSNWAEPRQWRRPKVASGTRRASAPTRRGTRPVSYETAAEFVAAMSPAPAIAMTLLFYTGMRPIELFAMDADDVDPEKRWFVVRSSKVGEPRGVPMHDFLVPLVRALKARGGPMVLTQKGAPYPLTEDGGGQISSAVNGAARRTGIADVSPYTARHTVSTQLVVNGVHPYVKDQILGHAITDMSRRYTNVPQQPLIDAINTLPVPDRWRALPWLADPVRAGRRLVSPKSDAAVPEILRLRSDGATLKAIAAATGVSEGTVFNVLKRNPPPPRTDAGQNETDCAGCVQPSSDES